VATLLKSSAFDILHPTYYDKYFLEYTSKPFVLTVYDMIHEIYTEYFSLQDPITKNKKILCDKASRIIAISEQTKQDLIDIFKIPEEKIDVTLLASDFGSVSLVKPIIQREMKKYILFVGNREGYKNFYFTVIALVDILLGDKNIELLCTGRPFTKDEITFLSNFGVQDRVYNIYLNNDNELAWIYANAELFIFPSLYEGFGFPLLEAFANECPVVSSSGGSLPEVGGDAALYFNPKSTREIQDATANVLYNSATRTQLIGKGEKQLAKFTWDKCRTETVEVYKKVLGA
jgi:glycosyltransferase involved in cell wall biosynthesis